MADGSGCFFRGVDGYDPLAFRGTVGGGGAGKCLPWAVGWDRPSKSGGGSSHPEELGAIDDETVPDGPGDVDPGVNGEDLEGFGGNACYRVASWEQRCWWACAPYGEDGGWA